jgi:hemoglobin
MKDIGGREDIQELVQQFYAKVIKDELIGPFFSHVDWDKHLPVMYDFWESVLFFTGNYAGNPMQVHKALNARMPIQPLHFERWKELFIETVNELYRGEKAELACIRASNIAGLMQMRISG